MAINKKPTQDLSIEHGGIMLMLKVMEKVAEKLQNGEAVKKEHLEKIVEFIKNFADKCHHGKEEDILFPELIKKSSNVKLVNELLAEHKTGRDLIGGIEKSLNTYQPGNPEAIHIAINMAGYIQLLIEHIKKENIILFPLADKELSKELQETIEKKFEKLESKVIGVGKHEEYYGWLTELKQIYI